VKKSEYGNPENVSGYQEIRMQDTSAPGYQERVRKKKFSNLMS
jgi:hypothetical protein